MYIQTGREKNFRLAPFGAASAPKTYNVKCLLQKSELGGLFADSRFAIRELSVLIFDFESRKLLAFRATRNMPEDNFPVFGIHSYDIRTVDFLTQKHVDKWLDNQTFDCTFQRARAVAIIRTF